MHLHGFNLDNSFGIIACFFLIIEIAFSSKALLAALQFNALKRSVFGSIDSAFFFGLGLGRLRFWLQLFSFEPTFVTQNANILGSKRL